MTVNLDKDYGVVMIFLPGGHLCWLARDWLSWSQSEANIYLQEEEEEEKKEEEEENSDPYIKPKGLVPLSGGECPLVDLWPIQGYARSPPKHPTTAETMPHRHPNPQTPLWAGVFGGWGVYGALFQQLWGV